MRVVQSIDVCLAGARATWRGSWLIASAAAAAAAATSVDFKVGDRVRRKANVVKVHAGSRTCLNIYTGYGSS
jgi:hypothetical protein